MADLAEHLVQTCPSFRRARLPALYSDFRSQRSLNPDGYVANLTAWRSGLDQLTWDGSLSTTASSTSTSSPQRLVLETDSGLPAKLSSRQFGRPLALGTVVREAQTAGDLVPVQEFLSAKQSLYGHDRNKGGAGGRGGGGVAAGWGSTVAGVPWNVASWAARQLGFGAGGGGGGSSSGEDVVPKGRFVVLANLERAAAAVEGKIAASAGDSRFERTFTRAAFEEQLSSELGSSETAEPATPSPSPSPLRGLDMDVLLRHLDRDRNLLVTDGNVVRIRPTTGAAGAEEDSVTQEDVTVAELRALTADLSRQNALLTARVGELSTAARAAVASKKPDVVATGYLRQKKTAEATLRRRADALAQMEDLASKIQAARDQVQLVRVLEGSASVLGRINSEVGGVDKVENVMEELRVHVAETDEVGRVLADAGGVGEVVDDEEVDEELRAMEREQEEEKEKKEAEETARRLAEIGTVPSEGKVGGKEGEGEKAQEGRSATPTTEAAQQLEKVSLEEKPSTLPA